MGRVPVNSTGPNNSLVTVHLYGDIDLATSGHLRTVLAEVIMQRKPARIVVDLCEVTALDSSAIGTLRAAYDAAHDVHRTLVFRDPAGSRYVARNKRF
jgi:anti-anti-sigma factor